MTPPLINMSARRVVKWRAVKWRAQLKGGELGGYATSQLGQALRTSGFEEADIDIITRMWTVEHLRAASCQAELLIEEDRTKAEMERRVAEREASKSERRAAEKLRKQHAKLRKDEAAVAKAEKEEKVKEESLIAKSEAAVRAALNKAMLIFGKDVNTSAICAKKRVVDAEKRFADGLGVGDRRPRRDLISDALKREVRAFKSQCESVIKEEKGRLERAQKERIVTIEKPESKKEKAEKRWRKKKVSEQEPPYDLTCPIGFDLLSDAVSTSCGHVFNAASIHAHMKMCVQKNKKAMCPMCNSEIHVPPKSDSVRAVYARSASKAWLANAHRNK